MPRTVWAGLGALGAALLAQAVPRGTIVPWGLAAATCAVVTIGVVAARATARPAVGWAAAGAVIVLVRLAAGALWLPVAAVGAVPMGIGDFTATIDSVSTPVAATQRVVVDAWSIGASGPLRLWVLLPRYPQVIPGDRIGFLAQVTPPPDDDPGFAAYLSGIGASGTAAPTKIQLLAPDGGLAATLERVRRQLAGWLAGALPQPQAGLAAGLLLGLRDLVPRDVATDFTTAGLNHVIAIDGWKVALVAGLIGALARPLPRRRRAVAIAAGTITYALLAGAGASVLRATLMALAGLVAREAGRARSAAGGLGLAVLGLLAVEPSIAADPGFHLSVAATAGLMAWSAPFGAWLREHAAHRVPRSVLDLAAVSLVAQAASLPLVLIDFGQLSPAAPIANILVAPLVPPVVLLAVMALATGGLLAVGMPHLLGVPVTLAGGWLLGVLIWFAHQVAAAPFATVLLGAPAAPVAGGIAALGLLLVALPTSRMRVRRVLRGRGPPRPSRLPPSGSPIAGGLIPRRQALAILLAPVVAAAAGGLIVAERAAGQLRVTILDVGQGDAILVEGDRGARLLVDGGPDPDRLLALLDARLPAWDRRLDLLVLTHPHEDHVGGFAALLGRYRVGVIFEPGMLGPGPAYHAFEAALHVSDRQTHALADGQHVQLDGASIDVRWPVAGSVPRLPPDTGKGINDVSIVLDIRFGRRRVLLMGDTEEEVDPHLLAAGLTGPVDVLKVAHHGSGTASTAPFLEAVRPRVAVISVGAGNPYGHPAPATVERLRGVGATVYRTDLDGTVEISIDGRDLVVRPGGARAVSSPRGMDQGDSATAGSTWLGA